MELGGECDSIIFILKQIYTVEWAIQFAYIVKETSQKFRVLGYFKVCLHLHPFCSNSQPLEVF